MESQISINNSPNPLQKWAIPAAIVLLAVVLLISKFPNLFFVLVFGGIVGMLALRYAEKKALYREAVARASAWKSFCAAEVVGSSHPNETPDEVEERAEYYRNQIRISGNPYASIIPVTTFIYRPMSYGVGGLAQSWPRYKRELGEAQFEANMKFLEHACPPHMKATFASQVFGLEVQKETV